MSKSQPHNHYFEILFLFAVMASGLSPSVANAQSTTAVSPAAVRCEHIFAPGKPAAISRNADLPPAILVGEKNDRPFQVARRFVPIQKISVIIPTYRELYNGNVQRLVDSLARQNLDPQMVELVFVVNNSPAISSIPTNPILIENQKTLVLLKTLATKFNLQTLDLSTRGIETNMGILRQRGSEFAIRNSKVAPDKHILVHMDADTVFAPDFLSKLYDVYSNYAFDAVFVQRIHVLEPQADDLMLKTFYKFKRGDTNYKFHQAMTYGRGGVATPQISSRASALQAVGGFPPIRQDEDFQFTRRLSNDTVTYYSPDIHVTAQDRARPDGFDARLRDNWNKVITNEALAQRDYETPFETAIMRKLLDLHYRLRADKTDVTGAFKDFLDFSNTLMRMELRPWYHDWHEVLNLMNQAGAREQEYHALHILFAPVFDLTTPDVGQFMLYVSTDLVTPGERDLVKKRVQSEIDKHNVVLKYRLDAIQNILKKDPACDGPCGAYLRDPFLRALTNPQSTVHKRVIEIARNETGFSGVLKVMTYEYPDWLLRYGDTPNKANMFEMRLLTELLLNGHNEPGKYPGFSKLYYYLRGDY